MSASGTSVRCSDSVSFPGDDPGMTFKGYQPLIDHLTDQTPFLFRLSLGRNTDDLLRYVEERMAEVVPLGVVRYLEAHNQFGAVPLVRPLNGTASLFRIASSSSGEDSPLRSLSDLEGRSLALGSFHSTLSTLIPRNELLQAGVELEALSAFRHFDSDEAVLAEVIQGRFDAGAVSDMGAYQGGDSAGLSILHVSDPVSSPPWLSVGTSPNPSWRRYGARCWSWILWVPRSASRGTSTSRFGFAPSKRRRLRGCQTHRRPCERELWWRLSFRRVSEAAER